MSASFQKGYRPFLFCFLLPFFFICASFAQTDQAEQVQSLIEKAQTAYDSSLIDSSLILAREALDYISAHHLEASELKADALKFFAFSKARTGNRAEARTLFEQQLELYILSLGLNHPKTAQTNTFLADLLLGIDNTAGLDYAKAALKSYQQIYQDSAHWQIAEAYHSVSRYYSQSGIYDSLFQYVTKSIQLHEASTEKDYIRYGHALNNLGWYYDDEGDMFTALECQLKAREAYLEKLPPDDLMLTNIDIALGNIYTYFQNYELAISYLDRAFKTRQDKNGLFSTLTGYPLLLLGIVYNEKGDYDLSSQYYRKAIAINDSIYGPNNRWSANIYGNEGNNYLSKGMLDSAGICYHKAIKDNIAALGPDNYEIVYPYASMGELYEKKNDLEKAELYYRKTLTLSQKIYGEKYRLTADMYTQLSRLNRERGDIPFAVRYADLVLASCQYDETSDLPFSKISYPILFIGGLRERSRAHEKTFQSDPANQHLISALDDVQLADHFIEYTRKKFYEDGSKQIFAKSSLPIYEQGISICHQLFQKTNNPAYFKLAFSYGEKSKNLSVLEALQSTRAFENADIPQPLLDTLKYCQTLRNQKERSLTPDVNDALAIQLKSEIASLTLKYDRLLQQIEKDYPAYYQLKYQIEDPGLKDIQKRLLPRGESLISYFIGDENIYTFVITPDTFGLMQNPLDSLYEKVSVLRRLLENPLSDLKKIAQLGHGLYQKLLGDVAHMISGDLIIVPDNFLAYLPFEVLVINDDPSKKLAQHNWLLHSHVIQYAHSVALWYDQAQAKISGKEILAFAPVYDQPQQQDGERSGLSALTYNEKEAKQVASTLGGRAVLNKNATAQFFIEKAPTSKILHLAMHAVVNDRVGDASFLAFSSDPDGSDQLFVQDLYHMQIPAELAVLSACETGVGELRRGEGMISFARAFQYAGTKSMVTSLWKINDETTSGIMSTFYDHLKSGVPKHIALKKSKEDYLTKLKSPMEAHPYYWAAFVTTGDMSPIDLSSYFNKWVFFIGVFGLFIVGYLFVSRK